MLYSRSNLVDAVYVFSMLLLATYILNLLITTINNDRKHNSYRLSCPGIIMTLFCAELYLADSPSLKYKKERA